MTRHPTIYTAQFLVYTNYCNTSSANFSPARKKGLILLCPGLRRGVNQTRTAGIRSFSTYLPFQIPNTAPRLAVTNQQHPAALKQSPPPLKRCIVEEIATALACTFAVEILRVQCRMRAAAPKNVTKNQFLSHVFVR